MFEFVRELKILSMKIVIVGAGACGLGAARHSAELIRDIPDSEIIILEKSATLGGFWCWDEESHGSLYNDVHINTPKELMAFQDFPFPDSEESFVHQSVVRKYLDSYAEHFDLKKVTERIISYQAEHDSFLTVRESLKKLDLQATRSSPHFTNTNYVMI